MRAKLVGWTLAGSLLLGTLSPAVADLTPRQRADLSTRMLGEISEEYGQPHAPDQDTDVARIFNQIASHAERRDVPYQLSVVDRDVINAYALPSGQVVFFTGLLRALPDRDALAFVSAHEISHIELHHGENSVMQNLVLGTALGLLVRNQAWWTQVLASGAYGLVTSGYSREMEAEADRNAMSLMERAGYSPQGALVTLKLFKDMEAENDGLRVFPTHPRAEDRYNDALAWMQERGIPLPVQALLDGPSNNVESVAVTNKLAQGLWSKVSNYPISAGDEAARLGLLHMCEALTNYLHNPRGPRALEYLGEAADNAHTFGANATLLHLNDQLAQEAQQLMQNAQDLDRIYRAEVAARSDRLAQYLWTQLQSLSQKGQPVDPDAMQATLALAEATHNYRVALEKGGVVSHVGGGQTTTLSPDQALEELVARAVAFQPLQTRLPLEPRYYGQILAQLDVELVQTARLAGRSVPVHAVGGGPLTAPSPTEDGPRGGSGIK